MKSSKRMLVIQQNKMLRFICASIACALLCCIAIACATNQKAQIANAANNGAETIGDKYIVMKGTPGVVDISNLIKIGMEPIGHANYIYGGGWNEADDGGGIEALTIGVAKSWKDFERKQDKSYSSEIEPLDYTKHKEVIHYGLDCSAFLGWTYYNMFNDGKDHVTFAVDMGEELEEKGYVTKTYDVETKQGQLTFKPGDIMTNKGHCWICLGQCADGSVLVLHSQGVGEMYEGVSLYGTVTADESKNSQAIALANEYLDRYYTEFNAKYQEGYSSSHFLNTYNEYTWKSDYDKSGLQPLNPEQVMVKLFNEKTAGVTCTATGTTPSIKINRATVTPNTGSPQKFDSNGTGKVDITLKVPYSQQFTSVVINGADYSSQIPATEAALAKNFENGYTFVKIAGIAEAASYEISTRTTPATTFGVGCTTWEFGHAAERPDALSHIENAWIAVESVTADGTTTTEPVYYSSTDWINDAKNGYGAFPVGSTVKARVVPTEGYKIDSVAVVPANGLETTVDSNEYTFTAPGGDFKLEVKTSKIVDPQPDDTQPTEEDAAEPTTSVKTGDAIGEFLFRVFAIKL